MHTLQLGKTQIAYEVHGNGPALLLIAPGGMWSHRGLWDRAPFNPLHALADSFSVVGMDQRNAGGSSGPIDDNMGWDQHTADQLALMDHLGHREFAVLGMCIGGAYIAGLIRAAKQRVLGAVMLQPIGFEDNRETFHQLFDGWAEAVAPAHPCADLQAYKHALFGAVGTTDPRHQFLFNASRDEVAAWDTPLLVALGNDVFHPESTSREVVKLAAGARLLEAWKGDAAAAGLAEIRAFLQRSPVRSVRLFSESLIQPLSQAQTTWRLK